MEWFKRTPWAILGENAMRFAAICKEQPAYAAEVEKTYEVLKEWKPDVMITCHRAASFIFVEQIF